MRCLNGSIDFVLECEPAFDYGRQRGRWQYTGDGYGEAEAVPDGSGPRVRLTTDLNLGFEGPRAIARHRLLAGEQVFCALSWGNASPPKTFAEAHQRLASTGDFWHGWISRGNFPDHPWRNYLQRSALTLKGLIYAPTGALLAAATSSLPETPGGDRNYDYRYSWLRDSTFMLWGLYTLGFDGEANDFFRAGAPPVLPRRTGAGRTGPAVTGEPAGDRALRSPASEKRRAGTLAQGARRQAKRDSRLA